MGDKSVYYRNELKRKEISSRFDEKHRQISKQCEKMLHKIIECCPALGQARGALSRS